MLTDTQKQDTSVVPSADAAGQPTPPPAPKFASVSPVQQKQPAQEPAVVSSSTIPDKVIPQNTNTYNNLSDKGTYVDSGGTMRHSDGSLVPAPIDAQNDNGVWKDATGQTYGAPPQYVTGDDPESQKINELIGSMKQSLDAGTKKQIDVIEQNHALLTSAQQGANDRATQGMTSALLNTGGKFAPADTSGRTLAETSLGLQKIAALDAQENSQLAAANKAQADGNQQLFDKALADVQATRTAKQAAAQKVIDKQTAAIDASQKQQEQASRDTAIADLVNQGISDPSKILDLLNVDNNGKLQGDFTADEVSKTLKSIANSTGAAGIKGLTGDVGNFYALKNTPGALPASILALPDDQQLAAYIGMVNLAKKGVSAASGGGATDPAASAVVGANVPVVGFDTVNGPNPQDQAAFLAALPGGEHGDMGTKIRGLTDYSISPSTFPTRLLKGQTGLTQADAVTLAKQFDPSYDEKQYATRAAMQKNIESGAYSQVINSANTLVRHLAELKTAQGNLPGSMSDEEKSRLQSLYGVPTSAGGRNLPFINNIKNRISNATGGSGVNNFVTARDAIGSEAAKIYKGTGAASESEIDSWKGTLSPDQSNEQIDGAIKMIVNLMAGKLSTISTNYQGVMGKSGDFQILTPQSVQVLKNLGIDPGEVDPTYHSATDIGNSSTLAGFLSSAPAPQGGTSSQTINWGAAQ